MSSKAWRPIWIMTLMSLACVGAAFVTLRAFAQEKPETQAPAPATQNAPVKDEAATIADDPTVAPDPAESADNNVTFPVDI